MALGKRRSQQQELWIATTDLPKSPGHPFYGKLNELLAKAEFDRQVEEICRPLYHERMGRPSIPPGVYFRMIFVGFFEGIGSQRGIAWRCSDSRSLAEFLGFGATEATPDHSSLTRTHQRIPQAIHEQVFRLVLSIAAEHGLVDGKTVGVDSTTLEANAAIKSIVRRDTGEDYQAYLKRLAQAAGIENPSAEELRRFDKNRKDKTASNDDWQSPSDPDSRIAKMKDGTTHLAYKAEHVVDLNTEIIVGTSVYPADHGDAATLVDSVLEACDNVEQTVPDATIKEAVADKGYHAAGTLELAQSCQIRTYIPEPERRENRCWTDKPAAQRAAYYANRRRVKGARSKRLQRLRSERTERSFAHVCETGGGRRCWLRGLEKVTKRYLIQVAARNLATIMRKVFGIGTARSLQGAAALFSFIHFVICGVLKGLRQCQIDVARRFRFSIIQVPR